MEPVTAFVGHRERLGQQVGGDLGSNTRR